MLSRRSRQKSLREAQCRVKRRFPTLEARIKLQRLYPSIQLG
jgi:hypothetical protein